MQYNFNAQQQGTSAVFPNVWLKLTRSGNTFTAYQSTDGLNWTLTGSTTLTMNGPINAGLFVSSHNGDQYSTASFDNVTVTQGGALPTGWTNTDIGAPLLGGSTSYNNSIFTLNGAGSDIWQTDDQMQYAYQPINGDATILAHMISQTNTNPWAKAGIMIKQSATAQAPYVWLGETPGNGLRTQSNFTSDLSVGPYFNPQWLKLQRSGNTFTSFVSVDGKTWTQENQVTASMSATATAGLFINSHNTNQIGTAMFDNVTITQP